MNVLIVVDRLRDWPLDIPGVTLVAARSYLGDPAYGEDRGARVFNLCKSYRYQSLGYYVSLLAEARGHRPLPAPGTIEDLQQGLVRPLAEGLDEVIQQSLAPIESERFELSIYFGRNLAKRHARLSLELFNLLQAPLLRARFSRHGGRWRLDGVRAIDAGDIPPHHQAFAVEAATAYFAGRARRPRRRPPVRFDLAILCDPDNVEPPSNARALEKFHKAAGALGLQTVPIGRADFGRLAEFDALFIRDTTFVNHYTYRFARRAQAEGLVVIDDPASIVRCNNKVYLAELLGRHRLPTPRTLLVHRDNVGEIVPRLDLPCVLKQPDSSFSRGVVKVESEAELHAQVGHLLERSDLIIAQEWLPTRFDWRVGVLDRRPLFLAKYLFPEGHWQIYRRDTARRIVEEGPTLALALGEAPPQVLDLAVRAANLIGDGLYGVDIKEVGGQCYVIEVNDNPNIDAGNEDGVLGDALYREVMAVFLRRIEARKAGGRP